MRPEGHQLLSSGRTRTWPSRVPLPLRKAKPLPFLIHTIDACQGIDAAGGRSSTAVSRSVARIWMDVEALKAFWRVMARV